MATKKKRRRKDPLAGKRDPVSQLYRAVRRYVEHHKGNLIVIGGIQVIEWPDEAVRGKFTIGIGCLGRKPVITWPKTSTSKNGDQHG